MMRVPAKPVTLRSDLYLTKSKMMNNAKIYDESWAKGTTLVVNPFINSASPC